MSTFVSKGQKPLKLTLTPEQEHTFHFGKAPAYEALMQSLPLAGGRPIEFLSLTGESLHVHHP